MRDIDVSLTHSHTMAGASCVVELEGWSDARRAVFEPLYTAAEMRLAEEAYPGFPATASELMDRAGTAVAHEAMRRFPSARRFAVVCGGGSNGGDGRIAAHILREAGREAVETEDVDGFDVIVDALFRDGLPRPSAPASGALIDRINGAPAPVVAVDVPSGVNASTGEVDGPAVEATLTVTFHARKVGLVVAPGRFRAGRWSCSDIGLEHVTTAARRTTPAILESGAPPVTPRLQVHRRDRARDRRWARHDGSAGADGNGGPACRRGVRDPRRPAGVAARRRGARASSPSSARSTGRTQPRRSRRKRGVRCRRARSRASGAVTSRRRSFGSCSSASSCRSSSTRMRCSGCAPRCGRRRPC